MGRDDASRNGGSPIDRRGVLKSLGAGTAASAVGIGSASAGRSARGDDAEALPWEFQEIRGRKKRDLLNELCESTAYRELLEVVRRQGGTVRDPVGQLKAARLTANGRTRAVVSIEVKTNDGRDARLNIERDEGEGVSVANVGYSTYAEDGIPRKKEISDVAAESDRASATDAVSVRSTTGPAVRKTVETEERVRNAIRNAKGGDSTEPIDARGLGDGPCNECKWAATLICQNGCGLGGGLACGLFGITAIGGVACTTLVTVVCSLAAYYGCSRTSIGEAACEEVNLC